MPLRVIPTVAALALGATALLGLPASAQAAPQPTAQAAGSPRVAAATCFYEVQAETNVRSRPSTSGRILRVKYKGEVVSGPCNHWQHVYADGYWWAQVYLSDGTIAYMISKNLAPF
ncbi:SH3 domain-containing protein [Streptomyces sp. SID13031]|uniref:SH3 domain-containing protein n=1 Tax=Streptomyces sp. SID13031 TaxID=2706046 RepID=UPI0013C7DE28|nr:SH3 domain-containing protein [Streptomyces sp. SID13031]NEA37463.1 SH3 domain-containing protein [Streptomyces sp. SID13031]